MARVCDVCGKGKMSGNERTWAPNLRTVHAVVNGTPKTIKVCTRCLRSGKIERA